MLGRPPGKKGRRRRMQKTKTSQGMRTWGGIPGRRPSSGEGLQGDSRRTGVLQGLRSRGRRVTRGGVRRGARLLHAVTKGRHLTLRAVASCASGKDRLATGWRVGRRGKPASVRIGGWSGHPREAVEIGGRRSPGCRRREQRKQRERALGPGEHHEGPPQLSQTAV